MSGQPLTLQINFGKEITVILHIAQPADVEAGNSLRRYRCGSLDSEGFIHCCTPEQLAGVVERYYSGVAGLMLLSIDPDKLIARLEFENTVGGSELFPHIYGEINLDAVTAIESLDERCRP